jgi:hypothetical protein
VLDTPLPEDHDEDDVPEDEVPVVPVVPVDDVLPLAVPDSTTPQATVSPSEEATTPARSPRRTRRRRSSRSRGVVGPVRVISSMTSTMRRGSVRRLCGARAAPMGGPYAEPVTATAPPATAQDATAARTRGLSHTADGREVPPARHRLTSHLEGRAPDDRMVGWVVTLVVTGLAGLLRFWNLGYPRPFLFDETYYAKDAFSLWKFGYARDWVDKVNDAIVDGRYNPSMQKDTPSMVVHPEVGKWLIGAGEKLFGFDSFGWRFPSAVVGTLMVLVMIRLARRVTGSNLLGGAAGVLMTFDGLQLVLSRLALLDIYVAFFLLSAVSCLVADRDWGRARMAALIDARGPSYSPGSAGRGGCGPVRGLRWRPWRLAAGLLFGLAIGTKCSALVP